VTVNAKPSALYQPEFFRALRAGDESLATSIVQQARADGMAIDTIYYEIFAPSMIGIGHLWESNQLSVAEEHLATAITERLIVMLSLTLDQAQRQPTRRVVLGCIIGEHHVLGLRMLADMFRQAGWQVLYLGADIPPADWVALAVRYQADVVAISMGHERHTTTAAALTAELHRALPAVTVLVGGAAFDHDPALWRAIGADMYDADPTAAIERLSAQ